MLSYEEFVDEVKNHIEEFLPSSISYESIRFGKTNKVNRELDTISLIPVGEEKVSPCMYLQDMYQHYKESGELGVALTMAAATIGRSMEEKPGVPDFSKATLVDRIFAEVINTAQNETYIADLPHRDFEDLSVIYRSAVIDNGQEIGTVVITNDLASKLGFTEEELHELAMENTMALMEPKVRTMQDVLAGMLGKSGHSDEEISEILAMDMLPESNMYVVTNEKGLMGANAILFPEVFEPIAERMGTDLFILPSSRHELIAISSEYGSLKDAADMVQTVNMTEVNLEDRLSNQVYKYDAATRTISCATDTPYKRLDGTVEQNIEKELSGKDKR